MKQSQRVYERLAQAFPHEFKLAHGDEMLETGEATMAYLEKRRGFAGIALLLVDAAVRLPLEYLTEMRRDLQYAVRALIKSPGFALVGILSMGLAIGLTTNVYSSTGHCSPGPCKASPMPAVCSWLRSRCPGSTSKTTASRKTSSLA
jgi:hypothetical protein